MATWLQSSSVCYQSITEGLGLEGTLQAQLIPTTCRARFAAVEGWNRAPSSLASNIAKDGASTASLGSLCQCLTNLGEKNFLWDLI